ncbi:MAG: helix-turn-helix domain-containing protein [Bacteroidota bacterium]
MAVHDFWGHWDYQSAYEKLVEAHELNPQDPEPLDFMAEINRSLGDFKKALELNSKGLEVNPLSTNAHYTRATLFYLQGLYEDALRVIDKGLQIEGDFQLLHHLKAGCLILLGRASELDHLLDQMHDPLLQKVARLFYSMFHDQPYDASALDDRLAALDQVDSPPLYPWDLYLRLYAGETEVAIQLLADRVTSKMGQVACFKNDPFLAPLRKHPVFIELVTNNFPDDSLKLDASTSKSTSDPDVLLNEEEVLKYKDKLIYALEERHVHFNTDLTLRSLAETIDLHPNKLSWLLNEKIGQNFNDFINSYRLKAFQEKAVAPQNSHLTLLGLAYDSGFTSKSVFNDFFKKTTGLTPKAWVKQAKTS